LGAQSPAEPVPFFVAWDSSVPSIRQTLALAVEYNDAKDVRFLAVGYKGPAVGELRSLVMRTIGQSQAVIAVVDKPNATVGWELGFALSQGKPLALVRSGASDLPEWTRFGLLRGHLSTPAIDSVEPLLEVARKRERFAPPPDHPGRGNGTLLLCAHKGVAKAVGKALPDATLLDLGGCSLADLPRLLHGAGRAAWVISEPGPDQVRDGSANGLLGIAAGFLEGCGVPVELFLHQQARDQQHLQCLAPYGDLDTLANQLTGWEARTRPGLASVAPPRVFVSYSHDSPAHIDAVLQLANRLRQDGVDARLDRYENNPPQGWPRWMMEQVTEADFIVCVCTATYRERFEGRISDGKGRGVNWEGFLATLALADQDARSDRLVPVLPVGGHDSNVPTALRGFTWYPLADRYPDLLDRVLGQMGPASRPLIARLAVAASPPAALARSDLRNALEKLLQDLYTVDAARGWVRYHDLDLSTWLPDGAVAPARFFGELALQLEQRSLVSRAFFADRTAERPGRRGSIEAVRELFVAAGLVDAEHVTDPTPAEDPLPPAPVVRWPTNELSPTDPTAPRGPRPPTHLHLDRIDQWRDVRARASLKRPQVFLFHAPSDQSLQWFVERVVRFLNDEDHLHGPAPGAEVVTVSTAPSQGGLAQRCTTEAAWIERITRKLAPRGGTFAQALVQTTSTAPVLLVLDPPFREGSGGTPTEVFDAFLSALSGLYARTLAGGSLVHPVHLFVAVHGPDDGGFVSRLRHIFSEGQRQGRWGSRAGVSRVHYPTQEEVQEYITDYLGLPVTDSDWWARLIAAHSTATPHYAQLSQALDELLAEVWPGP
jgi:SEFIR domain